MVMNKFHFQQLITICAMGICFAFLKRKFLPLFSYAKVESGRGEAPGSADGRIKVAIRRRLLIVYRKLEVWILFAP